MVELTDDTEDPAIWGKTFRSNTTPTKKTVDQSPTKYGGSESLAPTPSQRIHAPSSRNPRSRKTRALKKMWAGYAFAIDFREERGHAFMRTTRRSPAGKPKK